MINIHACVLPVCVCKCEIVCLYRLSETTIYTIESSREIWQLNNEVND